MIVDILLSTYNGEKYLAEQIQSILDQTNSEWRLLIRDDGSQDKTTEILKEYEKKYLGRIIVVRDEINNLGSTNSFLYLLSKSAADLVFFCDQDDVWKKTKIEYFISEYKKYFHDESISKPCLCFSGVTVVDEKLKPKSETKKFNLHKGKNNNNAVWNVLQNDVTGCAMMINKALKDLCLSCKTPAAIHHDWYLSLLATICGGKRYLPEETVFYRQHGNNIVGIKKNSFIQTVKDVVHRQRKYPYYAQVASALKTNIKIKDEKLRVKLCEFSELGCKPKTKRVLWHIKNRFLRSGNVFIKIYQLIIC